MADLAVVFQWMPYPPAELSLTELMQWHERARLRSGEKD